MLNYYKFMLIIFVIINNRPIILNASKNNLLKLIKPIHYLIYLQINPDATTYSGSVNITYVALKSFNNLLVDGIVTNVSVPGYTNELSTYYKDNYYNIRIKRKHVQNETYSIFIKFINNVNNQSFGIYSDGYLEGNQKSKLIVTYLSPTFARYAYPCFDHPALKAVFEFKIERPHEYKTLSNMPIYKTFKSTTNDDYTVDHFQKTVNMSTYVVGFCVNKFKNLTIGQLSTWARPDIINDTKLSLHFLHDMLVFFETYFDYKYNLPKLDVLAIPHLEVLGMQNWGLITISEDKLVSINENTTYDGKIETNNLLTHEIVHQWIGNIITHKWWNDIWLIEGMTTYFQYIGIDGVHSHFKKMDNFGIETMFYCFKNDLTNNGFFKLNRKILDNTVLPIDTVFPEHVYLKGATVIRMCANIVTAQEFQALIQNIIKKYAFRTITATDFFKMLTNKILEYHTKSIMNYDAVSLFDRMYSWITTEGYPILTVNVSRKLNVATTFHQERYFTQPHINDTVKYWIPISYTTSKQLNFNDTRPILWMSNKTEKFNAPNLYCEKNEWLLINLNQTGYYRVNYDNENWNAIIDYLNNKNTFYKIPTANRIQLIDDALQIASKNTINVTIPLNLIKYMKYEIQYGPWVVAGEYFVKLLNAMLFKPEYEYLKIFVNQLIEKVYDNLGYTNTYDSNEYRGLHRINVLQLACKVEHWHCIRQSKMYFNSLLQIYKAFTPNKWFSHPVDLHHRTFLYCTAIKMGTTTDWHITYDALHLIKYSTDEYFALLYALTCTENPALLEKFLLELIGIEPIANFLFITDGRLLSLLRSINGNPIGFETLYNILWTYKDPIKIRWNHLLYKVISISLHYINYQYQLDNYKRLLHFYFGDSEFPQMITMIFESLELHIRSFSNHLDDIEHFLNTSMV